MVTKIGEYQGKPILEIKHNEGDKFAIVSFGLTKAKAILECIGEIRDFVNTHDKRQGGN